MRDLWENTKNLKKGETKKERIEKELEKCEKAKKEILKILKKYNLFLDSGMNYAYVCSTPCVGIKVTYEECFEKTEEEK